MDIQVDPFCANENRSARAEGLVGFDRKRVSFSENIFYEFRAEKIAQVGSVKGKAALLRTSSGLQVEFVAEDGSTVALLSLSSESRRWRRRVVGPRLEGVSRELAWAPVQDPVAHLWLRLMQTKRRGTPHKRRSAG